MKTFNGADLVHFSDLPKYLEIIEKELINILPIDSPYISDPVRRLINAKSKRIRPSILLGIVANLDGEINDEVISACVAIELVHIASLIHDDIVDHANTRWLIPTINSKEGLEYAVIIGDYIFAKANEKAASVSQEVALVIARTIALICDGEARELTDEFNINRSMSSLIKCIEGKTAALISAACNIGGLCSGLPSKDIYALNKFGYYFGISFQFIDDLLDFLSNEKILGKAVANDVREGVYTMPTLLGINNKESSTIKLINDKKYNQIASELIKSGSIEKSIVLAYEYNKLAAKELKIFSNKDVAKIISEIPINYFNWSIRNLVDIKYQPEISKILKALY